MFVQRLQTKTTIYVDIKFVKSDTKYYNVKYLCTEISGKKIVIKTKVKLIFGPTMPIRKEGRKEGINGSSKLYYNTDKNVTCSSKILHVSLYFNDSVSGTLISLNVLITVVV